MAAFRRLLLTAARDAPRFLASPARVATQGVVAGPGPASTAVRAPVTGWAAQQWSGYSVQTFVHRNVEGNSKEDSFEFTAENLQRAQVLIDKYPPNYKKSAVIPMLDIAQQQNKGWLTIGCMNEVARILEMPEIRVYEVATFYSMYNRFKVGKYHVMVCGTSPCMIMGSREIEEALMKHLNVEKFKTTEDGMFTLGEMECMGCCVNAPMICVADYTKGVEGYTYNYYEDLTPKSAIDIIEKLRRGEVPRVGSQTRDKAEPGGKQMTLNETPPGPFSRDLDAIQAELKASAAAEAK